MPDKKYLIEIPDMPEGSGIWDADKWERNKDTFMADYPEANVFELGDYDENDSRETDQIMLSFEDNEELSGIWDSAKWERNKEAFVQDYPEAKVNRVRYVDYWGDAARQNRARREELSQPDVERDARLAEIGYFDDFSGEQKQFDVNAPATMGLKPVSSAIRQNSVSGETEYLDPRVAEFYANDTAYTDKLAERARLDAEYEENPSVIARREYDAQLARYADDLKKQIESDMESDVDKGKLAKGFARKNMPGTATAYATSGNLGKDTIGERLENEKYERYSTAVKLLDKAKIARDVAGKGFGGAVIDWAKEGFMDKTTQSDIEAYNEIGNILSRIEKEVGALKPENITEEVFEKYLSKDEQALIKAFFEYNSAMAEAQQDMSGWYKGGKIFAESIPFMLEFLATGGLYKTAGKAATRGLEKALVKWITKSTGKSVAAVGRKVLSSNAIGLTRALAGTAARTLVSPGTYDRLAEASLEIDDEGHLNRAKNAAISLADSYVENLSEISGGLIGKGLGYLGKGAGKLAKAIGGAPLAKIGSWLGDQKLVQGLVKGWTAAAPKLEMLGFHGLPEEIGEEFIGNTIREFGIQPGALEEMVSDDNFGAMLIGFAPMTLLGAAGGAISIGVVNAKASKLGNEIREMLSGHYDTKEIDSIMQSLSEAKSAKEIKEMLKPMEASVMDAMSRGMITREQAVEEIEMLYQYGGFIAQNNALLFGQQARENELATAKRAEMADRYGRFWQEDETETVEVATLNNGSTVFVVSTPAEDGKIAVVDAVTGQKGFANTSDIVTREVDGEQIQATNKMTMSAFLNGQIAMQRKTEEETRMANERNAQIDALRAQVTPGTRLNLGTEGSPVYVFAKKVGANGVTVVDETGMETLLGWDQAADALGQPIVVETDQQKLDAEISARLQRLAERRMQSRVAPATQTATEEAAQETAEAVAQEQKHIPMNEDGTVNEAAFWMQDPEGYVQWNDEQNKDGGQDSLRQIAIAKQELIAMLAEVAAGQNTSNPTMRKAAEKEVAIIQDKIARLEAMEQRYAETLVENVKQTAATPTATMSEEQLEQMDAQYQGILSMTRVPSERVRVMQEYLNKLAEGSVPVVLLTKQNYEEKMKADGLHNAIIRRVKAQVDAGRSVAGFMANGKVYLMDEGLNSIDAARITYIHERQHTFNRANNRMLAEVAKLLESKEKAIEILKTFVGERGIGAYESLTIEGLADEIVAYSMEKAYTTEDFSVDLQSRGIPSEVISIITDIDNEQRKDQSLSQARRRRGVRTHAAVPGTGSLREDGRNLEQVSGGVLEQQTARPSGLSGGGAQVGEGAESGEVEPEALLDETGFEVDEENEDVRFSVRYLPTPEQRNGIIDSIVKVTGQPRDVAERWLDSELSLASIVLNDKEYLDYAPDAKYKAIKDNSDYPQGTVDFNNICRKRKDFTRMYTRLQRSYPNRIFTAEDLADIRTVMSEDGLTVACGLCYVEDRRQKLGEVANAFIEDLQDGFRNYAKKNATKKANAAQFAVLVSGDTYVPSIYDLITLEGSDKLYEEHRGIWEAFGAYNRARGQQTQNTFQGYAEYKREILTWSDAKVKKVNSLGGLRIFSYSDFEAHHLLDIIQIIIDCAARGVMIQGYTKVPEFARVVEKTGIKLNRSLIPLGDTGIVDGKLAYDPVEGIDINDPNFLESNDNVGNILIGINDEQIRMAMADPFIHYIIPYHARQAGNIRAKLNVGAWTNYIDTQNERKMSDGKRVEKNINIYTDVLDESITNDREFVEKYLEVCREKGYIPKFDQFLDKDAEGNYVYTPGYYKFLVDFKLFDEAGNILPQKAVVAEFDDAFNAQILNDYSREERETTGAAMNSTYDKIVETLDLGEPSEGEDVRFKIGEGSVDILEEARKVVEREDAKESDVRMRITPEMDKAYMDAVEAGDMETAQRMVIEAARLAMPNTKVIDKDGNPKIVMHLSSDEFTKFGEGINTNVVHSLGFFTDELEGLQDYHDKFFPEGFAYKCFLNFENPKVVDFKGQPYWSYKDESTGEELTTDLIAARTKREGKHDGLIMLNVGDELAGNIGDEINDFVPFIPSQIKSADPVTYDNDGNVIPLSERFNPENEDIRFRVRTDEQREKLFEDAKAHYGVTKNFNAAGYMLPDGSLLDFSEANDGGDPNSRSLDHRDIEGIIMDNGVEYDSRWMYIADFMNEGAIRLLPESAGINLIKAPTEEQRKKIFDFIYKYNGEVILEINDDRLNSVAYVEYDRRTSPARIFRDIDGYFNEGIVPQQDVRFRVSNQNQAIFVSNAAKAVEAIKQEKATPEQWLKMLEKAGGLKAGEDKWMGLSDWLKASDKKTLTKDEVMQFVNEHMIVIEEQHYNDVPLEDREEATFVNLKENKGEEFTERFIGQAFIYEEGARGPYLSVNDPVEAKSLYYEETGEEIALDEDGLLENEDYDKLIKWAEEVIRDASEIAGGRQINRTRKLYTTRGLVNLHEIALTVPAIESWGADDDLHFGDAGDGRAVAWIRFGETWEQRPSPQISRKVLVIDEIQSKRHQEGRDKGYIDQARLDEIKKRRAEIDRQLKTIAPAVLAGDRTAKRHENLLYKEIGELMSEGYALTKGRVPDAPFDKNWHELAMKRMLRYAAENGFDIIAWTTGDQQANRYDLSREVKRISASRPNRDGERIINIYYRDEYNDYKNLVVDKDGKVIYGDFFGSTLADLVGKEMALQIMNAEDVTEFKGEGLKIGGEGMRGFYDKMLPAFMNKYGKKWGVKVEDIDLPNLGKSGYTMHSVPVTEEMKASVMEGQVMFRVRGENETAEEFYQSVLDDYKAKYNTLADMVLYPINQDTADGFGLTLEELEETGAYYEIEDGEFAIFVHEDADDSLVIENAIFHESIHFVEEFYDYMRNLGKWLWENAESVDRFKEWKEYVSSKYSEDEYHKEMLAYCVADALTHGQVTAFEKVIPSEYHDIVRQLENEIGYDRRTEESRREAERILQQSSRSNNLGEQKGVQKDKESEGGLRFRATEITPEVRDEMDTIAATAIVNGNYMKAPNGADTNLTAEQWAMVRTKNFKEWFGDWENDPENASKVVDENGEPMVVYHGTPNEFWSFDKDKIGSTNDSGFWGEGFYFTSQEALAVHYAEGGRVLPVFLNIRNPHDFAFFTKEYYDHLERFGMFGDKDFSSSRITEELTKEGKDGVIRRDSYGGYAEYVVFSPSQIKSATDNTGEFSEEEGDIRFKVVTDPAKIEELENGPTIKVYRAMQLIDGKLYPPMSAKVDGQLRQPIELGQWEEAEERPDLADDKGYFKLNKGNKKSIKARYNPYFHTSYTPLNDQFSQAQDRPNLVIVEVEIPVSELTSGYKADKAKDSVGEQEWKAGVIQGKLSGTRKVILSRWDKPIRIVPDSEVADKIVEMFEGKNIVMPSNVVTPLLREELEKRGIPFVETDNNGKPRKPGFIDVIKTLFSKGKDAAAKLYERSFFDIAKTPSFMKKLGLTGDKFTVRYGVLARHFGKDSSHDLTERDWQKLPDALKKPFAITKLISREKDAHKDNGYRIYTTLQNSKGEYVVVGVDVKNAGRDLEVNAIATVFGRRENAHLPMDEEVIYKSKKITPEQSSLLERPNSSQYPTGQELSEGKDTDNLETTNDSEENVSLRVTGTPTDEVVASGLSLSPAQTADLAGNIFAALPESARAEVTASLNGDILGLQDAIMQIPARLAMKENWDEADKELASVVREKVQDLVDANGPTSRPLTTKEALWMLHNTGDSYDLISAATDAIVARNLGFDPESIRRRKDVDDYIRFRAGSQGAIDAATDMYNYETSLWTERLKESWLDMNLSVVALQNALTQESGMPIEPWENIVYALNRLSSKSYADKKKYLRDYLIPLWDTILDIVKHDHVSIEEIERYMMLKHALERNEVFAKRDAREFYRGMFDEVARKMKGQSHAEQVVALSEAKKALADIDAQIATASGAKLQRLKDERVNAQYKVDVADLVLRGDEKQNEDDLQAYYDAIDAELDPKYREFREKDYGGLTSMFVDTTDVKRSDYKSEEAYQQAVLAATTPRYDDVAAMESAAEREVSLFENKVYMYRALWDKVNAATKETLRHQYESGMITVEQYEAVRDMFEFYVPLRGFADNTAEDMYSYYMNNSSNGFSMPIIGAKGRKTRAESPLGWIGTMAESAIQADNKNEAKMCLYYAILRRPNQNLLSITETWFEYTGKKDANGKKIYAPAYPPATTKALNADELRQHMEDWEDDMKKKQASGEAFKGTQAVNLRGSVIFQDDKQEKEHIIRVKVAGKDYSILINGNPRAAQAINGLLNPDANVGPVREWIGWARRGLSSLLTSFSPLFWVANYQRDLLSSIMRTSEAYGWGEAKRYLANRRKAWRVASYVYKYENGALGNSYYETLYKEFAENGGITGYTALTSNKEYEKLLEDYAKEVNKPSAIKWAKKVFDNFMSFGEAIEQVSRFAAFITARESGKSIEDAINAAKEVSVNFNRKGSAQPISREELEKLRTKDGKKLDGARKLAAIVLSAMPSWLKELYFFFNASVQAISSSVKLAAKSPGKAAGWAGAYFGMSIAMAMLNYLLSGDDDDEYLDLPDYLRHSTVLIKVDDEYYIKWSIPQEMRPFYAWADMLISKMMGKMPHKNLGKEMALAAAQWLPVNPFEAEDPLLSLVPDVASPIVEAVANKTSFGGKIYDDMAFKSEGTVQDIPAYRKATDKTGKVYVELAEILNAISGGDEVQKGWANINPAALEHIVEGYGGGIYDFAKMMVTFPGLVIDAATGEKEMEIKNIPFVNKVVMSVDETNMYSHTNDAFYHYKGIAESAKRIEKEYAESDDPSRAEAYREEEDWRIYLLYKQYEKDFKDVKERLDNAVDDTETDLLKQEQNALREMFLNDIAKGELPEVTFEIREDIKRIEKDVKKIMKPADDANKERLERKKAGDVDGMVRAIERRDSLKDTPEYQRAEEISKEVKAIKKQLQELGTVERKSQRDSVIGELQRNYERLKERMSDEISQLP